MLLLLAISQTSGVSAATYAINSTADLADASPGNGSCAAAGGDCTLRAALQEANATTGADTIQLSAGVYTLNLPPGSGDDILSGDLDITAPLTIVGEGPDVTILDGSGLDRVLEIAETAGNVTLSNLTIRNGSSAENGGGIYHASPGTLVLNNVVISNNNTVMEGGGIYLMNGRLTITDSTISGNSARSGGGLYNAGELSPLGIPSRVEISDSTISDNSADSGGGIYNTEEGTLTLTDVTFADNTSGDYGGGVANDGRTTLTIVRGTFTGNHALGNGGGVYSASERPLTITNSTFTHNLAGDPAASDGGEGGGLYTAGSVTVTVTSSTFSHNEALGEGGAITFSSFGSVTFTDSTVSHNSAENGGGVNNSAATVNFSRLTIHNNHAHLEGGGLINQGSGGFTLEDSNIYSNIAENGGGMTNDADGTVYVSRTTFWDNRALVGFGEESGLGGGIYSLGDAGAVYENVTISGNLAQVRGGALYIDADAGVNVINSTFSHNTAPVGSGVSDEGTNLNFPRYPSTSVIFRNTIVAGNFGGDDCNFSLGSQGGNIDGGTSCGFIGLRDRHNANPMLDAVADNGGFPLTMALQPGSLAIDGGVGACPMTDARGVSRPQNDTCDSGAFEYTGPFPPPDDEDPETFFVAGPLDDTEATSLFLFNGTDNVTAPEDLLFECRLLEFDPTEPPEPPDPTQPVEPEFAFVSCSSPWIVPVIEEGQFSFEVRAIDRDDNTDDTPAVHNFTIEIDTQPPDTYFLETPPNPSASNVVFTFTGVDNATPERFLEFECRLDTNDPNAWLECPGLAVFSNLTPGQHTFQVRAADGWDNIDPTPATHTWTVGTPTNCDEANITLYAVEDSHVDETLPLTNFGISSEMLVSSGVPGANARSLYRFDFPAALSGCALESATLRLYGAGDPGRTLQAIPVTQAWQQSQVTWNNQPATAGVPAVTNSGGGYREWTVTDHVDAILGGTPNYGWLIRDAVEEDPEGGAQTFRSREAVYIPPTPPQLVLRFEDAGLPPPPPPPAPTPAYVFCGQTIYESTLVQNDLLGCLGEGLIIGASDIILDLNGHTISSGMVVEPGEEDGLLAGIRNVNNDNVIIRNGTVTNYGFGVRLMAGATYNVVENMSFVANVNAGVELYDADNGRIGNIIRNNLFDSNGFGLVITNQSENSVIENNDFLGNGNLAIYLYDSSGHRIEDNFISGLVTNPLLDSDGGITLESSSDNQLINNFLSDTGDAGISLREGSHRNLIQGNISSHASDASISLDDADYNQVLDNVMHQAGGAALGLGNAHHNIIQGNDFRFNPGGIELGGGSSHNLIENNDVSYSSAGGISVEGGMENQIINNLANNTNAEGISVEAENFDINGNAYGGSLIQGNQANYNLGSGISVNGEDHTIADNTAYNNAGFGISASAGNIDGGGNTGAGNAEPAQCVGVVCSPGAGAPANTTDLTPPDTELLTFPIDGSSTAETAVFTFTGSDNLAPPTALRFECRLDAPPDPAPEPPEPGEPPQPPDVDNWVECSSPMKFAYLLAGEHTFEVRTRDPGANVDLTPATYTWTVVAAPPGADSTAPNTTILEAPDDPSTDTTATFRFSGSDNKTPGPYLTYQCRLDGGAYTACTSPITYTGLGLSTHTFEVRATDVQGNTDASPASHSWTIEALPPDFEDPETTITSGPDLMTVNTDAIFTFTANEAANFECSLDSAPFTACTSPTSYTGLSVDVHTFAVRAVDLAGNDDDSEATYTWEITSPPVPGTVSCGQTITESILLTGDVLGCLGDGLIIGADGITIDLGGYTLAGTGLGAGILNDGYNFVTVRNGTIQGFNYGVQLNPGTALNIIENLVISINLGSGIILQDADDGLSGNIIRNNELVGNGAALELIDSSYSSFVGNLIAANMDYGLHMIGSDYNHLEDNFITGSSDVAAIIEGSSHNTLLNNSITENPDGGLELVDGSNNNRIEGNYIAASGDSGVMVSNAIENEIVGNTIREMSDSAIVLQEAHFNTVYGNDVRFNSGGIALSAASNNQIEANNASSGGLGIEAGDLAHNNVILLNIVSNNDAGGIAIEGTAPAGYGNLIDRNTAHNNGGDGIAVQGVGHIIIGNQANGNDGWGIYSSGGSALGLNIDGGGNLATGNAEPTQCYNISCDGSGPLGQDNTPPETLINAGPPSTTTFNSATFTFSGFDNATAVIFECSLDGAPYTACASPITYTGLGLGGHNFAVRARDWSGNVDPSPATAVWTVEAPAPGVPPETTLVSGPDSATPSTSATFTFAANEPGVTFMCSLDGATAMACTSPQTYISLLPGAHTFEVYAVDSESLPDTTPATFAWTITPAPAAATVSCGQTLTQSTLVSNDLLECLGNGLIIGADGITLDLNGRTIDGTGLGVGILNNGFENVVITNGTVQEFDYGVQLNTGADGNVVSVLTLQNNQVGAVQLVAADNAVVRNNIITLNTQGMELSGSTTGALVKDNTFIDNPGNAIYLLGVSGNRVEGNYASGSSGSGVALEGASNNVVMGNTAVASSDGGVSLILASNNNRIEVNTALDGGSAGITVSESEGNELVGNTAQNNGGGGIGLELSNNNLLLSNDVRFNSGGINLTASSGNRLEANYASGAGGSGIEVGDLSLENEIVNNTIIGNSGEGIYISDVAPTGQGNLIESNVVSSNGGDGISVNGGGHTITDNTADLNGGWGIYASEPGMDGGDNRALGNSEPEQCFNVVCEIGTWSGQPDTIIVLTPPNPTDSSSATFTFTGVDDVQQPFELSFECRLDSSDPLAWIECDNPWVYTGLSEGEHTFEVRAIDADANIDPTPDTFTWLYTALPLGVPPDTFIDQAPPLESPLFEGFFIFSANEPDVTYECSLDGAPFTACGFENPEFPVSTGVFEFAFEEFEVGPHTFAVRAIDIEGLVDPTPATYNWNIAGLIVTVTAGPAYIAPEEPGAPATGGETTDSFATFEFVSNLPDTTYECSLDLGTFVPCDSGVTYTGLAVGEHLFYVHGTDADGRTSLEPTEYSWEVLPALDTTPPNAAILTGPPNPNTASGAVFTFTGTDNVYSPATLVFECRLDSTLEADFASCLSPFEILPGLTAGTHTLDVRAIDPEDNIDPTPASYTWTIAPLTGNTDAPLTTIDTAPETGISTVVTFTFSANEAGVTYECSLDNGTWMACASPHEVTGLAVGEHVFSVRGTDPDGNLEIEPPFHEWVTEEAPPPPDTEAPETSVIVGPADPSSTSLATFIFSGSDNESLPAELEFQCRLDSTDEAAWADCASPATYTGLSLGAHLFEVRAVDLAGNVDLTPASHPWTVVLPPVTTEPQTGALTTITSTPDVTTISTSATFAFAATESGANLECSLDGAPFTACASPVNYTGMSVDAHVFSVRDGAADPQPSVYVWQVVPTPIPTVVTCGQVLNHSVQLLNSLSNCPSGGLYIGAANIAVDLNGQTIDGLNYIALGQSSGLPAGITNIGFDNVVIYGGTVQEFGYGLLLMSETNNNTVRNASVLTNSIAGVAVADSNNSLVRDNSVGDNLEGIWLLNSNGNVVRDNDLDGNIGVPVMLENANQNQISGNVVNGETYNPLLGSDAGIMLVGSSENSITSNIINNAGDGGILLTELSNSNRVENNVANWTGDAGIVIGDSEANLIIGNTAQNNSDAGIGLNHANLNIIFGNDFRFNPAGIELEDSSGNLIQENNASNSTASGILLLAGSLQNHILDNTANENAASGIAVEAPALDPLGNPVAGNTIEGNTANDNAVHGIHVTQPGHTLLNNSANDNGQWGILTAVGTINGNGNNATGNGFGGQCSGIPCNVPPPNTQTGSGVTVVVTDPGSSASAALTFDTVSSAGLTTLTVDTNPPALPNGYLQLGAAFYDVDTTAVFSGPITLCLDYTPGSLPEPVQLLHYEGGAWTDVTVSSSAGQVCGQVSSLSPFAVTAVAPPETTIQNAPANPSTATTASFTFTADKPGSNFACSLDGAPFTACTSPASYPNLALGAHEFRVRATDAEGNVEPTPAGHIWTILAPVDCGQPVVFAISIDAWIDQNSPTSNKGTDSVMKLQAKGPSDNNRILVRFNLPTNLPTGCQIQTATLRMFAPSAVNGRTLQALRLTGNWTENGVTWNNQPGTTGAAATTSSGEGWREWDVAAQVQAMMDSGQNYGFLIRDASEGGGGFEQQFHAREKNENVPQLVITYVAGGDSGQDVIPPQTSIETGPEITAMDTNASFTFAADEPTIGFECSLNGAAFTACEATAVYSDLVVGDHTFAVRAIDLAGLIDPTPATYNWTVIPTPDTTPPQTTIDSGPAVSSISSSATFTFFADESGSTFECALNGAEWTACASPRERTGLALGNHTFTVRATDAAGNTDPDPASYSWTIVAPPETSIDSGPEATTVETAATFTFSANKPGSTFECALDGAPLVTCIVPATFTGLALGAHTFAVQAVDTDGHTDPTPETYTWTIQSPPDTTAPETTITAGPESPTLETDAQFTFAANEPATFECTLDGAAWATCTSPLVYTGLAHDAHTFAVRAIDLAGNVDATATSYAWTIDEPPPGDTTPPETLINAGPEASTSETTASLAFSANEEATFTCSLNGAPFTSCTSLAAYSGLALGAHTFAVQATDLAGNVDATPATYSWTVIEPPDTMPPHTQIDGVPAASTTETVASFFFLANEPSSFECALDGAPYAACVSPKGYSDLSVGDHTFTVRAIDLAGNVDPLPASYTWTVLPPPDTTPPQTTITSGPTATTPSTSASFSFAANEAGVTFECSLDGVAFVACASPREYSNLSAGAHTFAVRGTDAADNVESPPVTFGWTVSPPPDCGPQIVAAVTADAWVDRGSTSSNKGDDSILKVQGKGSNSSMRALVRFALPTNVPEGCVVESATLRLYAASWKNGRTLQAYQLNGNWTEYGVTWNNQPATTGTAVTTTSGSGWRQWNVTGMVQTMLNTGVNHGFLIRDASESGSGWEQQFHAREKGNNIPVLIITLAPAGQ